MNDGFIEGHDVVVKIQKRRIGRWWKTTFICWSWGEWYWFDDKIAHWLFFSSVLVNPSHCAALLSVKRDWDPLFAFGLLWSAIRRSFWDTAAIIFVLDCNLALLVCLLPTFELTKSDSLLKKRRGRRWVRWASGTSTRRIDVDSTDRLFTPFALVSSSHGASTFSNEWYFDTFCAWFLGGALWHDLFDIAAVTHVRNSHGALEGCFSTPNFADVNCLDVLDGQGGRGDQEEKNKATKPHPLRAMDLIQTPRHRATGRYVIEKKPNYSIKWVY